MIAVREQLLVILIAISLVFTPLMGSGRNMLSLIVLEMIAILLFILSSWHKKGLFAARLNKTTWLFLWLGLLLPIFYLIPLPFIIWEHLPGRELYIDSFNWVTENSEHKPWLALSLVPYKTVHGYLAIMPLLAIFLATSQLSSKAIIRLAYILLFIASLEACLGIIQYANRGAEWAYFGFGEAGSKSAQGTYKNRDHYVALMYMTVPLAMAMVLYYIGQKLTLTRTNKHTHHAIKKILLFSFALLVIILGGILSNSRAGIFLIIFGIILSTLLFARHIGGEKQTLGISVVLAIIGIGLTMSIGLIPIVNRFIVANPLEDLRWKLFADTMEGIKAYLPWGTGPSTFQDIYRTIQPIDRLNFINHAHNDYLELVFELGIFGVVLIALGLIIYLLGWRQLRGEAWKQLRFIRVGAGIGLLMLLIHSLVDFNLHTPANAVVFTFLAAVFLMRVPIK